MFKTNFYFVIDTEQSLQLLSQLLAHSPNISDILFKFISVQGLMHIAASRCAQSLRTIDAKVNDAALVAIQTLCQSCPNLRSLHLENDNHELYGDAIIQTVLQHCPLIEALPTYSWDMTDTSLNALANIHTLKQLHMSDYDYTSEAVQRVLTANSKLVALGLGSVDDALVKCIGRCCGNLTKLVLGRDATPAHCSSALVDLFKGCPLLDSFILYHQGAISHTALPALFEHCRHLTTLELVFMQPNEPLQLAEPVLYAPYPTLTKLKVTNHGISTGALLGIVTYCTNLQNVTLCSGNQVTDEVLTTLTQHCKSLRYLSLLGCRKVTTAGMIGMLKMATHCSTLRHLSLSTMPVTDAILTQISLSCPALVRLTLWNCRIGPITDVGIRAVAETCTRRTYLTIRIYSPDSITHTLDVPVLKNLYPHVRLDITDRRC